MAQRLWVPESRRGAERDRDGEVLDEIADRYGPLRDSVLNLAAYARIRGDGRQAGHRVDRPAGSAVVMKFRDGAGGQPPPDPTKVLSVLAAVPTSTGAALVAAA